MSVQLFFKYYNDKLFWETVNHIEIIAYSLPFAVIIGVLAGFLISSRPLLAKIIIALSSIIMTVPSLALFGIAVVVLAPFKMGLGIAPAALAIILYSFLPIIRNTYIALNDVDPAVIEAARGMGFSGTQVLLKIKAPLAVPVIMAGVRNAMVMGISVATFAFLVAAGGLGYFIFSGISRTNTMMVLSGAVVLSLMGIGVNYILLKFERLMTPRGIKIEADESNR